MRRLSFLLLVLPGCGEGRPERQSAPDTTAATATPAAVTDSLFDAVLFDRGQAIHEEVCAQCHTLEPPPLTAPTLNEISARYHEVYQEPLEAIDHLSEYIRQPVPGSSHLPQATLDEWGVMPPQALPDEDRRAAAYYVWHLRDRPANR